MALQFPTNPTINQTYSIGTTQWTYNGVAWVKKAGTSGTSVTDGNVYVMPAPTGIAVTDQAALVTAFQSPFNVIEFGHPGTYLMNATITWPSNKYLKSVLPNGSVEIKASSTMGNGTWMFTQSSGLSNFGAENIKFNANYTARNSANNSVTNASHFDFGLSTASSNLPLNNSLFINCQFIDHGGYTQSWAGNNLRFIECSWDDSRLSHIQVLGATIHFIGCSFSNYNKSNVNNSSGAIFGYSTNIRNNIVVSGCKFFSGTSTTFGIEVTFSPTFGNKTSVLNVCNNFFDGNNVGGIGISGNWSESVISNNVFTNCTISHQSGIECTGYDNVISNNSFTVNAIGGASASSNLGEIMLISGVPDSYTRPGGNNIIIGNTFNITTNNATLIRAIELRDQVDVIIKSNAITFNISGTATINGAIQLGNSNRSGAVRRVSITDNILRCNMATNLNTNGINMFTGAGHSSVGGNFASDVYISSNIISGFRWGIASTGSGSDSFITAVNNNMRNNINPGFDLIGATTPGTNNIFNSTFPR